MSASPENPLPAAAARDDAHARSQGLARQVFVAGAVTLAAVALTYVFFSPLWHGGGLVGGDIYAYFLPQKQYYAAALQRGDFPLWNNLVGHGYPILGESQTGACYPPHLVFYRLLDAHTAYHVAQLGHYVLAFVLAWMYARRLGFPGAGAALTALVYVYGWFPARLCWEWAIIGGTWLPLALWCVESFLQTRLWRYALGLSAVVGLQLLAGHYHLAFITQLVVVPYALLRIYWTPRVSPAAAVSPQPVAGVRTLALLALAVVCGFGLAAVQLLPSWELRGLSQRAAIGPEHDPAVGFIPVWYWSQMVWPAWYDRPDLDQLLVAGLPPGSPSTNRVEAHLYFGWFSCLLMAWGIWRGVYLRDRRLLIWAVLGIAALLYTPGWLVPLTQHLPGFGYFRGPGRLGIVTTLAAAILAGAALADFTGRLPRWSRGLATAVILMVITRDLWLVAQRVNYAPMVAEPPIQALDQSPVRQLLARQRDPVRLFSRGANLPTLLGVASTPVYLGIGPAAYYDPDLKMPEPLPFDAPATAAQIEWLRRAGVTHVLSFGTLDTRAWPVRPLWVGYDPFLNPAWARREPLALYELTSSRGRVAWIRGDAHASARVLHDGADRVEIETASSAADRLLLTDLSYPGWQVTIDGRPAEPLVAEGMYRAVDVPAGSHRVVWTYAPRSVLIGAGVSGLTLLLLLTVAHFRFWNPRRAKRSPAPAGPLSGPGT